ncbi:hypothetical protein [Candidatus Rickettsia kedanie]
MDLVSKPWGDTVGFIGPRNNAYSPAHVFLRTLPVASTSMSPLNSSL